MRMKRRADTASHAVAGRHKRITGPGGISTLLCDHTAQGCLYPLHGLFLRRMDAVQLVLFAHRYPFVFTQLMVGQQLDFSTLPISRVNSPVRCAESSSSDQPGTTT